MGTYINIGNAGFQSARNGEYVDKSGLIAVVSKSLFTKLRFSCITRCRRFGKSMAAEMLCAYYDMSCDSRNLFSDLEIANAPSFEKHLNKYAAIYLDTTNFVSQYKNDDIVEKILIPRKNVDSPAIVLELKFDKDADSAISQIRRKQYPSKVAQYSGDLLLVGINYDKKEKTHECKIQRITTNLTD